MEANSDTHISQSPGQDREGEDDEVVDVIARGIASLRSEALNKLNIIGEWINPNLSEYRQNAEQELTQLITLLNRLVDEEANSFLNRFDTFCSNAVRKCPDEPHLLTVFGRRKVFLDKVAHWGRCTNQGLCENVAKKKSQVSSNSETGEPEGLSTQLTNKVKEVQQQLENPNVEVVLDKKFENINMSQREYRTKPKPFYGLSEEPLGQHAMAKVTVETRSVVSHAVRTIHSFSGANAESPPHVWVNQVRHYAEEKSSDNPYLAQLFGYNRSGERFDLIYLGSLIPFEEQLTNTQPLQKIELISKTSWKLHSACSYFIDQLNVSVSTPMHLYMFLITMIHYNKDTNEMILCGDFTQWHTKGIFLRSKTAAQLRLPAMFSGTSRAQLDDTYAPTYPHFSRARDLYGDLSLEQLRAAILNFYEAITFINIPTDTLDIPFYMRGIHVDPRIQKPCSRHLCRPMVDIWNKAAEDFIEMPRGATAKVPRYKPKGTHFHFRCPTELATDSPRYLEVLTSKTPHSKCQRSGKYNMDPAPLALRPVSWIWFSQAGRIFSSSQFQKSGLQKRDIMYIRTNTLNSVLMLDPPSPEDIPVDLAFYFQSFHPHMDMHGIHIGPTKWDTVDPLHRSQICESAWTLRKCFYCTGLGFCWDDDTYEAIDEFHRSLGMDPYSGEMAELLGFPLLDIDDLLHTAGWTCSHPTIKDSMVEHTLTHKDIKVSWDPAIHPASSMIKDGTSEINIKMRQYFDEN